MSSRSSSVTSSGLLPRQRASARATASALHPQGACVITASYSERENLDKTLPNPLTKGAESNILLSLCGHGGTGRRVRLRGVWFTPSEFKSRWPHQKRTPGKTGGFSFPISEAEGYGPGTYAVAFRPDCAVDCRNSYTLCRCLCARCQNAAGNAARRQCAALSAMPVRHKKAHRREGWTFYVCFRRGAALTETQLCPSRMKHDGFHRRVTSWRCRRTVR